MKEYSMPLDTFEHGLYDGIDITSAVDTEIDCCVDRDKDDAKVYLRRGSGTLILLCACADEAGFYSEAVSYEAESLEENAEILQMYEDAVTQEEGLLAGDYLQFERDGIEPACACQ